MFTQDLDYDLPKELIAQEPIEPRDHARLLVIDRKNDKLEHHKFYELGEYLQAGDVLVINDTKVIRARLTGRKIDTGGKVDLLLLQPYSSDRYSWKTLIKPIRKAKAGSRFVFGNTDLNLEAKVHQRLPDGSFLTEFDRPHPELMDALEKIGEVPLPPYIKRRLTNDRQYQTIYAKEAGSVAAPTAGLHFTEKLFYNLQLKGIHIAKITLHVGWATFKPITTEIVEQHQIGVESYKVDPNTANVINSCWQQGRKIIAVGTTTVRTLETVAVDFHRIEPSEGWTKLMITVGHKFKAVDALVTNFHLPRSTNLLLVSAFCGSVKRVKEIYSEAIRLGYRFYSFGDAMLIL